MTEKKRCVTPAGALPPYLFWILLIVACVFAAASSSYADPDLNLPELNVDGNAVVSCTNDSFQPVEISLNDKSIRAGLLYDVSSDSVVWGKNTNQAFPIASLTKMMVALIAIEDIFEGKVSLDTTVKVTAEAARMKGSKVYLRTGCCLSVEELLKAAMIASGNDAAYLLAQFLGGTESVFVMRMNRRASQLGMKDTVYSNATGMPARDSRNDNRSSPSDLLLLSREMLKYNDLLEIAGMSDAIITQDQRPIKLRNHNVLVATFDDVDGFKTGFTVRAKYCLVATANKNDRRLISIVLGAASRNVRNQFTANSISRYYEALGMGRLELKTGFALARCIDKTSVSDTAETTTDSGAGVARMYQVKRGDTLYQIATRYGCKVTELKAWNQIRGNRIDPGQKLAIYQTNQGSENGQSPARKSSVRIACKSVDEKNSGSSVIHLYTVRRGDTLWKIARKFEGVSVKDIMKTNRIKRAKALKPGTTLKIMMDA